MKKHVFKIHHVKKPDGIKPFQCSMCDVKFASERFLKSHVGIVHKNMEISGENDKSNSEFENHNKKMVNCIICDAELFDDLKSLENHFESAHDVKKYGDSGKIYENQNEKLINCQVCDTEFDDHKKLEKHFESAHDVKKSGDSGKTYENQNEILINCQVCGTEFDDHFELEKHFDSAHDVEKPSSHFEHENEDGANFQPLSSSNIQNIDIIEEINDTLKGSDDRAPNNRRQSFIL